MNEPKLTLDEKGQGAFTIVAEGEQLGEMVVAVSDSNLTVYHTEVMPKAEGQGLAKTLLNAMVTYARSQNLKVIPLCPYVHAQFKRHPEAYEDIWNKAEQ
ncbi:MAG: GNAT family N-acetyltransferase [Bacteroidota bacterium]